MGNKPAKKRSPTGWLITALVVVIFCVAVVITVNRLIEWNRLQKEKEALQQEKETLEQQEEDPALPTE
jgi:nitrogen fixation protein FixH